MFFFFSLIFCLLSSRVSAQTSELFQWQFANNVGSIFSLVLAVSFLTLQFVSTSLPTCFNFSIIVKPFNPANDTTGLFHAPFYMIAFEVGGARLSTISLPAS